MTKREFVLILVRLLGLYFLGAAANQLSGLQNLLNLGRPGMPPQAALIAISVVPFFVQSCWAVFLLIGAEPISRFVCLGVTGNEPVSKWSCREALHVGLTLIGGWALMMAAFSTANTIVAQYAFTAIRGGTGSPFMTTLFVSLPGGIYGILLIVGARFLSYWLAPREARSECYREHDDQT